MPVIKPLPRVLIVAEHFNEPHGSALSAIDILRSIQRVQSKDILSEYPIPPGAYLHQTKSHSWSKPYSLRFLKGKLLQLALTFLNRAHQLRIRWWLMHEKFDIVIVNGFGSRMLWEKVKNSIPDDVILTVVSRESPRHFDSGDRSSTLQEQTEFLSSFDAHIFVSEKLRSEWIKVARLSRKTSFYLPNCCEERPLLDIRRNEDRKCILRAHHNIQKDIPLLLNIGTLELRKGQQDLIPLARYLESRYQDFCIVCVGFDATKEGSSLRRSIEKSPIGRFFLFPGVSKSVVEWYREADILVFTSRAEAMPRTILEAMASSLPIVSTNVDGIPELIEHKKDGYLYSPGDVQSLIDCVETLLTYPDTANKVSASARCKYVHNFSQERHHERLDCILNEIISIDAKSSLR